LFREKSIDSTGDKERGYQAGQRVGKYVVLQSGHTAFKKLDNQFRV
jgi:hypothetical protein